MINLKNTRIIIIGFIIFSVVFFMFSDTIVSWINKFSPWEIFFISVFLNPIYLIFIYSLFKSYGLKGMVAGFLISTASDVISLPHFLTKMGEQAHASLNLLSEYTFWNLLPEWIKTYIINIPLLGEVNLGAFLVYVVITIALIIAALMITHKKGFKKIFSESV